MSHTTITWKEGEAEIPVTLPHGLEEDKLRSFHPFKNWIRTLHHSLGLQWTETEHPFHVDPYVLRSVEVQSFDLWGGERLGFLKLNSEISNRGGETLPGAVFLRGPSVAMLVILVPDDAPENPPGYDERYVLLTVQPRVAAGSLAFVELPAGMVDEEGQFAGTAAKEIKEELGLDISKGELTCLSELAIPEPESAGKESEDDEDEEERLARAMFPSAGGCDEYVPIYMHERRVPRKELSQWTGQLTGLRDQGEKITLKLVKMADLWREGGRDSKALAALALWDGLRREGKL